MAEANPPLRLTRADWRRRWLQTTRGLALHRVSTIQWGSDERISGRGETVCGRRGRLMMPGIFSRMDAPRCVQCCQAMGIPCGDGAPYNALKGKAKNA